MQCQFHIVRNGGSAILDIHTPPHTCLWPMQILAQLLHALSATTASSLTQGSSSRDSRNRLPRVDPSGSEPATGPPDPAPEPPRPELRWFETYPANSLCLSLLLATVDPRPPANLSRLRASSSSRVSARRPQV